MTISVPDQFPGYVFENSEVAYSSEDPIIVDRADIERLEKLAHRNDRNRARLCAHQGPSSVLHEMLIIHEQSAYVRPHKHHDKSESMHIVKGLVDLVLFTDAGEIERTVGLGDYQSGLPFFYRLSTSRFHTLLIRSSILVFHETTNGPFDSSRTEFAPWAPDGRDPAPAAEFLIEVDRKLRLLIQGSSPNA